MFMNNFLLEFVILEREKRLKCDNNNRTVTGFNKNC